jgi:site-specific DNA-cytosine methylase
VCTTLGGDMDEFASFLTGFIDLNVPRGGHVHLHASPPCQLLSGVNTSGRNPDEGIKLVIWALDLIHALKNVVSTWTLEQVAHPSLLPFINTHGGKVIKMQKYGIPQTRKRLFLGNIDWTSLQLYEKDAPRVSDIISSNNFVVPHGYTEMHCGHMARDVNANSVTTSYGHVKFCTQSLENACFTITGSHPKFHNPILGKSTVFPLDILKAFRTFPPSYRGMTRKMIGNAVPPEMARILISTIQC